MTHECQTRSDSLTTMPSKLNRRPLGIDITAIRDDFPILREMIHGRTLVYFDNAATTQKPRFVLDAMSDYYSRYNSNIHRGVHKLSETATLAYEEARKKVQKFINARESREIIFVGGATEGVNLVAQSYGMSALRSGDEIVISTMEHHSNIVPWQMLCQQTGAVLRVIPINDHGELILEEYERLLGPRTKIVSVAQVSNALGTVNPIAKIIELARERNIPVLVDGAQATPHLAVDVQALDCDFYVFSGHKTYGPTGIGILYGKAKLLDRMPPYQGGGDMIASVSFDKTTYNELPFKFEAGTPNIAGAIGLGAAVDYLAQIGLENILAYEDELLSYATRTLSEIPGLTLIGTARDKAGVLSFTLDGIHPHDIGTILDRDGIAIRAGHHCAQPLMKRLNVSATARASFVFYNTHAEIDALAVALAKVQEVFR